MQIRFLGAAQAVTGSMHRLDTDAGSVLIDCGMFQGRREESRYKNSRLPREAISADAMILTHAHIDHSGSIPTLSKQGFTGKIWATPASGDLCDARQAHRREAAAHPHPPASSASCTHRSA